MFWDTPHWFSIDPDIVYGKSKMRSQGPFGRHASQVECSKRAFLGKIVVMSDLGKVDMPP